MIHCHEFTRGIHHGCLIIQCMRWNSLGQKWHEYVVQTANFRHTTTSILCAMEIAYRAKCKYTDKK